MNQDKLDSFSLDEILAEMFLIDKKELSGFMK